MSLRPRIVRPCPALADLDAAMDGSFCRLCKKTVHDLDAMSAAERCGLLLATRREVCVRYRLPAALAATAMAVAALPVAAQTQTPPAAPVAADAPQPAPQDFQDIIVGGARRLTAEEVRQYRLEAREEARRERRVKKALFPR